MEDLVRRRVNGDSGSFLFIVSVPFCSIFG